MIDQNCHCCSQGTLCRRPPSIVIGLFLRTFIREGVAAAGPLLIVLFEDSIVCTRYLCPDDKTGKFFAVLALIVVVSLVAYGLGALIGVVAEAMVICCAGCCCRTAGCCCRCAGNTGDNNEDETAIPDQYWL